MLEKLKLGILSLSSFFVIYGLVGGFLEKVSAGDKTYRELATFTRVLDKVQNDYVEVPDMTKAEQGALQGMLEALDPFSSFVEADVYQELSGLAGTANVGLTLSKRSGYAYVVAVVKDSPADKNGLRSGDLVESIEGKQSGLMSLWEAQHRLAGDAGTQVSLRILRSRRVEPQELVLQRENLPKAVVSARIIENNAGYLRVPSFEQGIDEEVRAKVKMLLSSGVQGILIDLRGAANGAIESAVAASDLFLPKGAPILETTAKRGAVKSHVSLTDPLVSGLPVVMLIDGGTSGAAEVFAAALVDNKIAETVGDRTNGCGSVQETFELQDGSRLILSTQLLVRPSGEKLQSGEIRKWGITPDVLAPDRDFITNFYYDNTPETDEEDLDEAFYLRLDSAIEAEQLKKAEAYLAEKIVEAAKAEDVAA